MERISIIVPIYNSAAHLCRCLDSLRAQTWQEIEVLLIDDGSTDGSAAIAARFCAADARFRYFFQQNAGVSAARNTGLMHASGDFIGFCDSDDYVDADMYAALCRLLTETGADVAACAYHVETSDAPRPAACADDAPVECMTSIEALVRLHRGMRFAGYIWNKLARRALFHGLRFSTELAISEDVVMCAALFERSRAVAFRDVPYYHYVARGDSAWNAPFRESYWSVQQACRMLHAQMLRLSPENAVYSACRIVRHNLRLAEKLCAAGLLDETAYDCIRREIDPHDRPEVRALIENPGAREALALFLSGHAAFTAHRAAHPWNW